MRPWAMPGINSFFFFAHRWLPLIYKMHLEKLKTEIVLQNPFDKGKLTFMIEFILGSNLDDTTDRT